MCDYGVSDAEMKMICMQVHRRAMYREEFLRLRTDPCKNSQEAGYVFDGAHQRFLSMKACQYESFRPTFKNTSFALLSVVLPMVGYGYLIWDQRNKFLTDCRCGRIRYKDRKFKLQ